MRIIGKRIHLCETEKKKKRNWSQHMFSGVGNCFSTTISSSQQTASKSMDATLAMYVYTIYVPVFFTQGDLSLISPNRFRFESDFENCSHVPAAYEPPRISQRVQAQTEHFAVELCVCVSQHKTRTESAALAGGKLNVWYMYMLCACICV